MTFDRKAYLKTYMREYRAKRSAAGLCQSCGLPHEGTTNKCAGCQQLDLDRERLNRRHMRLGKAAEPHLREAVERGEYAHISPAEAKRMLDILDSGPVRRRPRR